MAQCKCCKREKDLRMGYCFDCVEAESIIQTGLDMYDDEIKKVDGLTTGMSKLQHILKNYIKINN
jgi:hypothetical protein